MPLSASSSEYSASKSVTKATHFTTEVAQNGTREAVQKRADSLQRTHTAVREREKQTKPLCNIFNENSEPTLFFPPTAGGMLIFDARDGERANPLRKTENAGI